MLRYGACRFPECQAACAQFTVELARSQPQQCSRCSHRRGFHEEIDVVTQVDPALQFKTICGPKHTYTLGWALGSGQYGVVFDALQHGTNERVAVKRMELPQHDEKQRTQLVKEIRNLKWLDHPYIVRFIDHFEDREEPFVYLVLERAQGTDLFEKVGSPKLRLTIALQEGQHDPAFFDGLRHAIARSLKVSPERVNVPISNGGSTRLRVDVFPPADLAGQPPDVDLFLRTLHRAVEAGGLGLNANYRAALFSARIEPHAALDEATALRYFRQILCAVKYMHENGVVHRDLKLENTMVDPTTRTLKLIDFGFSRSISSELKSEVGTPHYMAPELFKAEPYNGEAVDIWAIGVMLYLLLVGKYPFGKKGGQVFVVESGYSVAGVLQGRGLSNDCRNLFLRIFEPQPASRITLREIMADAWVRAGLQEDPPEVQRAFAGDEEELVEEEAEAISMPDDGDAMSD